MTNKKKRLTTSDKTKALAASITPDPRQAELIAAAVSLRAQELVSEGLSEAMASEQVHAEFDGAIVAVVFERTEDRFYVMLAKTATTAKLLPHVRATWTNAPGFYGGKSPLFYIAKK